MRWQTICFDLDNTLYSHEEAFERAICYCFKTLLKKENLLEEVNISNLYTVFKKYCDYYWDDYENGVITPVEYRRKRFLATVLQFQLPFTYKDADDFHEHYYKIVDQFCEPYPELVPFMNSLVESNINIGIITNGSVDTQYRKIKKLNLYNWVSNDYIFISEQVKSAKPDHQIFEIAKKALKSSSGYLYIGDSWEHDVVGSIEAGWDSIFLNTRNEDKKTSHEPVAICNNLIEVKKIIEEENFLKG